MCITSLKNQKEFELINKLGEKFYERYFILVIAKKLPKIFLESKYNTFLGIKVSRKLNKKAVVRNKIKRRIRHLMRIIVNDSNFKAIKFAIIIIPKKGFEEINFSHLQYELSKIILRNIY
ncbi:ribonuclease P protein component [Rickettsia prowazekii]|uniref:Ribonuclease P protein component n=1 Tax=Rickettsia prowazekii (strain Rp22) TaxID=449216 RepID=D5AXL1_RICPP|nr:ribonuclease P protein component [Rickettsia prowazekii]EOB09989.1 50S ribosomal protein L34 [Rickettsia prowazekii str. GvF12]ADE30150.1 Ribonuclease P [Rickettsia prowazekii str. Rp22]AFE49411.1 ribonuclease P [Rickettsia prowazekii str. Chernikova]AFE50255.1 ribonuclease P [Rickettsia prowazekii str. Katsinyian]AFE51101.1 ribonuclease P [Rickettsia prowazekii str. BuV67-CWPP]